MANMTAVYLPGDRRVDVRRVAVPEPGPDEVLVEIKASCICRSDLSLYYGNAVVGGEAAGRCITGHEPAGVVVKIGEAVSGSTRAIMSPCISPLDAGCAHTAARATTISARHGSVLGSLPTAAMRSS